MKPENKAGTLKRLIRTLFQFYPVMLPLALVCILFNAIVGTLPTVFMQQIIAVIEGSVQSGDWGAVSGEILRLVSILAGLYVLSLVSVFAWTRMMAVITQGTLKKLRCKMFDGMQDLPLRYFDATNHGDIMSYYTNDIDTLRQMVSQSFPQMLSSGVVIASILFIMLWYSAWLALVVVAGVFCMIQVTRRVGGGSAKYFRRQQEAVGKLEGFVEELMNGQKVVKVFCHEEETERDFDALNDQLYDDSQKANKYANTLMPILNNMGNVLYAIVAIVGGLLLLSGAPNLALSGAALSISIVVPFLNMTKQFSGNVSQVSQQVNLVVMGMAGAQRIFDLMDQQPEVDEGAVTLVNVQEQADGRLTECVERTNVWAWKQPQPDGSFRYTRLTGDVRFEDVDFG